MRLGPTTSTPRTGQGLAMRVEQIRRPVQRHGRLAGARPTLHDEDARAGRRPDGLVLLRLDGRHDVVHAARASTSERGEQGALADEVEARGVRGVGVEHLVVDAHQARPCAWKWRRRATPIGSTAVAR